MNMQNIDDFLKNNPTSYLWDDKKTIDICFSKLEKKTFKDILLEFHCPLCNSPYIDTNNTIDNIIQSTSGCFYICPTCGNKFFLHKFIFIGT
jgi:hypothetical protein